MKLIPKAHELISNLRDLFPLDIKKRNYTNEEPLRAELFSMEQMQRFGKTLANNHKLSKKPARDHLLNRLADNEDTLHAVHKLLTDAIKRKYQISPAGEWLMDNFYLVEEHVRIAKTHFPKRYSEDLPQLGEGPSAGLTRIYDIVLSIISHSDGRIDLDNLSGFIDAYQSVQPLQIGELWAIPIMLRLGLIENLRRVSVRVAIDRIDSNLADYWAKQMIDTADKKPKDLILVIADMARSNPPMSSSFVSEITRQLRGRGPDLGLSLNWMGQQLSETGLTSVEMVDAEIQKQAADQVSMSNSIASLRFLGALDWRDFVEKHSVVENTLREDATYAAMDFPTRDRYRHVVENFAKKSGRTEQEVARLAIGLSRSDRPLASEDDRARHVGYFLIDEGARRTREKAGVKSGATQVINDFFKKHAFSSYLFFIVLITGLIAASIFFKARLDTDNPYVLTLIAFLAILCASQLAVSLVNFFSTLWVHPHLLPRMNFSRHIPSDCSSMVAVPVMLGSKEDVEILVDALEVRFLANRQEHLYFGLLTDFTDAPVERLPEDDFLVSFARERIEALNKKYKGDKTDLFFLFHRSRQWNAKENAWMGYERKRGKLAALNALLRGEPNTFFSHITGDTSVFSKIKYVITLDADTQLPLGSAWKLIGTMAHPLNKPWYDAKRRRVTKGYGILQPRVTVSLPDARSSVYTRMHGNEAGIDPYTRASSDVYQDLFGEGSFIGKGIYDVAMFSTVLEGRFAENSILSHDLLEGCYIRSGLLSDVQLFEKYPGTYRADIKRRSRWIRGDWQIFAWITPFVPGQSRGWHKNPLSALSRWKIFDNIRRSLIPLALTTLILLGWFELSSSIAWTILVSVIIIIPVFVISVWDTINKPKDVIFMHHVKNSIKNIGDIFFKTGFTLICLPYEAFINVSAISRAVWRMLVTRKKLLEWNPSANEERHLMNGLAASYASMWVEPAIALVTGFYLARYFTNEFMVGSPILALWFLTPYITWKISRPRAEQDARLSPQQHVFLHKLSRKTWAFFERFVTAQENWLPPDNYQEEPEVQIAHRTSPTNIGLSLLAAISAHDFGYLTTAELLERIGNTLGSMNKMERFKGHFYNWYDTENLQPLLPKYISTVDSGNLTGHLIVAKQGLLAVPHQKVKPRNLLLGFCDTLDVLTDCLPEKDKEILRAHKNDLSLFCSADAANWVSIREKLIYLQKNLSPFIEALDPSADSEMFWWKQRVQHQLEALDKAIRHFHYLVFLEAVPEPFKGLSYLPGDVSTSDLLKNAYQLDMLAKTYQTESVSAEDGQWLLLFREALGEFIEATTAQLGLIENLAQQCHALSDIDWDFLYDAASNLFSIGYNVQEHRIDNSLYDLLASEARLATFIGIAQGKLPEESWFALGRLLTNVNGDPILLSWSGSMFEYLMPLLVMPTYENTLLDQTYKAAVDWQISYGKKVNLPWGISESGFNMITANSNYQYRAFGAPGLGLKRGLEEDAVIAPYASALSLMVSPEKATANLELLQDKGFEGRYGFYEAIDYTPSRLQRGQTSAIIYSFMAHHQGMSLLSLAYLLLDKPMQKLFEAEPQFKATLLLLQERVPRASTFFAHTTAIADVSYATSGSETRIINKPTTLIPEVQLLSNGKYHVMVTNSGTGYSRWKGLAVTRWREDLTLDNRGTFCYLRDVDSEDYWSNTHQPTLKKADFYEASFSQARVDFRNTVNGIETHTEIAVSPEDDIEMRRVRITNPSGRQRTIEVTSYAEVVLAAPDSDLMQPAFSNLFVQTEIRPRQRAIVCTRRPRSASEQLPWLFHQITMQGKEPEEISYETDRAAFIGRGHSALKPLAMSKPGPLSGNQGPVLDPIVAIRYRIVLKPEETVVLDIITGVADTKEQCAALVDKYQDRSHKDRVFELAWTHSQVVLRQINASEVEAQLYGHFASSILFTNSAFRAEPSVLINNHKGQSGLWGYSISGDLPIVLLKVERQDNIQLVRQLIQAHGYWRLKGIAVDLVIWNEDHGGYRQVFQNEIHALVPAELIDKPGGIFVRASDQISNEDRVLFETVARINLSDNGGTLADHAKRKPLGKAVIPYMDKKPYEPALSVLELPSDLVFFNGLGGFRPDGTEYVIGVDEMRLTPAPWVNVLANPNFGTVISESGTAYTWSENAHEFRLTPWNNDPVCDSGGEVFYLRDEESGHFWPATLLPSASKSPYIARHGFGYSVFEHVEDGIHSEMLVYVDLESAIKFTVIKIKNKSGRHRQLSATGYTEWVLGGDRTKTAMYVHTEVDPNTGALFAKNPYSTEFSAYTGFFDVDYGKKSFTSDRTEFIGRNGTLQSPDALLRVKLSGKTGMALDPCAAIQIPFELGVDEEHVIVFRLGAGKDVNEAIALVKKFRGVAAADAALEKVKSYWKHTLGALRVETPDVALNLITNGWLTYQTLSSRLWGRSGFYQSGGAFGFRDQLQDVVALLHAAPQLARDQILLCSSRQFREGDVQHWWHPPIGRGVRTRISDDYLWLPLVTSLYVMYTADTGVLDERRPYLDGRPLNSGEESYYDLPVQSSVNATLYEHCVQAILHAFRYGEHGLPLIGTGDWNDGYDKVGEHGKGESVWLAFFLYEILIRFEKIARLRSDEGFAAECLKQAQGLKDNIDKHAWDGAWYKRAWFDNGNALGTSSNEECKIDSIAQSWSVISGAGDEGRQRQAMESAYTHLVQKDAQIIQLLDPPFDTSSLNPGYIKGYLPGVRENGGQYTHAAVWLIIAFARLGDKKRVWELLHLINPVNHGKTAEDIARYKVEPYVLAADVYARTPNAGRGGWTWYTGSAGWMYRLISESFLGLQQEGDQLRIKPCLPEEWTTVKVDYRYKNTPYKIVITQKNSDEADELTLDGVRLEAGFISLTDDGADHVVKVRV